MRIVLPITIIGFSIWFGYLAQINQNVIPNEFLSMYKQFLVEAKSRNINLEHKPIIIKFDQDFFEQLGNSEAGAKCQYFPRPTILINKVIWEQSSLFAKELVLFHELSHCLMYSMHSQGSEYHVMNESFSSELLEQYLKNLKTLLDDLFYNQNNAASDYWNTLKLGIVENIKYSLYFQFLGGLLILALSYYIYYSYFRKKL